MSNNERPDPVFSPEQWRSLIMMRKSHTVVTAFFLAVALCSISFYFGIKFGVVQSGLLQSTVEATLLVGELGALRAGRIEPLIVAKEIELDGKILLYGEFKKNGHPWIFFPENKLFEHERYLKNIAKYRKKFPSVLIAEIASGEGEIFTEMRKNSAEVRKITADLINIYGD